MTVERARLSTFMQVLLEEIREKRPDLLKARFTVAEVYQVLVPYRTHRDRLGLEMIGDYDEVILRLLVGDGDYLRLEPASVRERLAAELETRNPNPGIFRTFAAAEVHLGPAALSLDTSGAGRPIRTPDPDSGLAQEMPLPSLRVPKSAPVSGAPPEPKSAPSSAPAVAPAPAPVPMPPPAAVKAGSVSPGSALPSTGQPARALPHEPRSCRACACALPTHPKLSFCPFCGTSIVPPACLQCDEPLNPEWRFCVRCGEPTGAP